MWLLIQHRCLIPGTATSVSIHGELGRWTQETYLLAGFVGVKPPASKQEVERKKRLAREWLARHPKPS